jgi:uncharacterized protein (DUF2252 family)
MAIQKQVVRDAVLTRAERAAVGKAERRRVALSSHAELVLPDRPDPVELLERQATSRVPDLVPIRYGRMLTSPFALFRGSALVMAADLARTPTTGLRAQLCGDAHLSNFGVFASPERRLVFDLNDFDETAPGPFEWDLKRLTASLEVAARENGFSTRQRRRIVLTAGRSYREAMRDFAGQTNLAVWYAHLDMDQVMRELGPTLNPKGRKGTAAQLAKARTRDSMQAFTKLTTMVDGHPRFVADPPLVVPVEDIYDDREADELDAAIRELLDGYGRTLASDTRALLHQFHLVHTARKVVGVGSVGTRAWILLMEGIDGRDPMLLQAKQAEASVLESYAGRSRHRHHGQRVVTGQLLMQAHSDIFLGWQRAIGDDGLPHDYYLRQLRDWKGSVDVERMSPVGMRLYARLCGWTLARAHARSGDRVAIAAYLGRKETFDEALADFAVAYADQNERDHAALEGAVETGRITAVHGL